MTRRKNATILRYCTDCIVSFQIYTLKLKRKAFCPVCGETYFVVDYIPNQSEETKTRIRWKAAELTYLPRIKAKEYTSYQVAILLGRSPMSVTKKYNRWLKERLI